MIADFVLDRLVQERGAVVLARDGHRILVHPARREERWLYVTDDIEEER
jgi:hypothetical protein